jgi:predicted TIM-barrel fold metal-dependent hydrolase
VAFLESGVGWVAYFLDRLHEHWEKRGDWIPDGWKRDPREYLARGQIFVTCESGEPLLGATADALGHDWIGWASDYPHWDSEFPESSQPLRQRADLSETARAAILGGNAARFFGLP